MKNLTVAFLSALFILASARAASAYTMCWVASTDGQNYPCLADPGNRPMYVAETVPTASGVEKIISDNQAKLIAQLDKSFDASAESYKALQADTFDRFVIKMGYVGQVEPLWKRLKRLEYKIKLMQIDN